MNAIEARQPVTAKFDSRTTRALRKARDLHLQGRPGEAVRVMRRLVRDSGGHPEILLATAQCELDAGDHNATATFQRALVAGLENPEQYAMIGQALLGLGETELAVSAYNSGAKVGAKSANALAALGGTLTLLGRKDEARHALEQALALRPQDGRTLYLRNLLNENDPSDTDLAHLQNFAKSSSTPAEDRMFIHFAIAGTMDKRGEYGEAFTHCTTAHQLKASLEQNSGNHYDRAAHAREVDRLTQIVTEPFLEKRQEFGDPSALPVLIVGMPRSGTTLVEQIIASHPNAHGAGELQHLQFLSRRLPTSLGVNQPYPDSLEAMTRSASKRLGNHYMRVLKLYAGPGKMRVVDKMWANYLRVALVSLIAPNARVIHCRRDPMDTCVSCYFQNFAQPLPFLHDLSDLGFYHNQYKRLMDHWAAVKPLPMLDVDYEALVADQEGVTREIIAFCGLEWDKQCLTFHDSDRFVQTASAQQVRQPIYRGSLGRWRNYRAHLDPLRSALENKQD